MINITCTFLAITGHCTILCNLYVPISKFISHITHSQYLYFLGKECSEESRKQKLEDTKGNASHHLKDTGMLSVVQMMRYFINYSVYKSEEK